MIGGKSEQSPILTLSLPMTVSFLFFIFSSFLMSYSKWILKETQFHDVEQSLTSF